MAKKWYKSKTVWINILAIATIIIQGETGFIIEVEEQTAILAIINIILRAITTDELK